MKKPFGQQLKALGGNEESLTLTGISVNWFKIQVFAANLWLDWLHSSILLAQEPLQCKRVKCWSWMPLQRLPWRNSPHRRLRKCVENSCRGVNTDNRSKRFNVAGVPPSWSRIARGILLITAIAISLNRKQIDVVK